ncbi:MAG: hypothetical protein ACHQAW_07895 [Actinomycetota bacterium]|jgi:hypothetical protein
MSRPSFYALQPGGARDYWTLLHPPYTLWHLSFVALGACVVDTLEPRYLVMALVAFFLAVGIAAHALDELHGRPLRTQIPRSVLISLAVVGVVGALAIGLYGASIVSWWGLVFIGIGGFLVPAYNLEWFGGRFHTDLWFAVMWGGFPALAGGFSQTGRIDVPIVLISAGCGYVAAAQRRLSTPVRSLRRRATAVTGQISYDDGTQVPLDAAAMTQAPEGALRLLWIAMVLLAVGLVITRWP